MSSNANQRNSKYVKDATKFTATGVWAHTKPGRATTLPTVEPAPRNETPAQKVKRLRERKNQAVMAQVTKWDYLYLYGRNAADVAHRLTVYGIIFATGCIGILAVFSIGDMVVYNRRKRAIWHEDQEIEQAKILALARNAVMAGSASPAQKALVEGIAEEEAAMQQKIAERKLHSRFLWWMHGDWKEEKALKEQRALAVADFKKLEAENGGGVTQAVKDARLNAGVQAQDQPAADATGTVKESGKGWLGWAMGKK
ncbi:hypothetical protein K504DRAFT_400815 [Pleomassaria siparia CBS 279.74]|uniref:Cytochrome oxidase c assembly-domain-containing protein n=1 Tax=Pleomassaria siparia CBS 279.74 TaxID=1314801 RepID=A0A6G1KHA3_9PLEO|nr:hypothetical protein K504DRAFT_400815 [Pleomassaria siparia CBS 279.74]